MLWEAFDAMKLCLIVPLWLGKLENLGDSSGIA